MFVSLCVCAQVCLHLNVTSCVQTNTASGLMYGSGCPNLWRQWFVSNQSEPWGFRPANYNVQWLAAMATLVGWFWGLQRRGCNGNSCMWLQWRGSLSLAAYRHMAREDMQSSRIVIHLRCNGTILAFIRLFTWWRKCSECVLTGCEVDNGHTSSLASSGYTFSAMRTQSNTVKVSSVCLYLMIRTVKVLILDWQLSCHPPLKHTDEEPSFIPPCLCFVSSFFLSPVTNVWESCSLLTFLKCSENFPESFLRTAGQLYLRNQSIVILIRLDEEKGGTKTSA